MSPDISLDEEITLFDRNGAACVFVASLRRRVRVFFSDVYLKGSQDVA
jgi:hypothetical protein